MADRRYRTSRWRKTRAYVIARDRGCMLNSSPRCNGRAETAHHTEPSSRFPELFFDVRFIVAACKPCNYSDGAYVGAENRRMLVAQLEEIIDAFDTLRWPTTAQALCQLLRSKRLTPHREWSNLRCASVREYALNRRLGR